MRAPILTKNQKRKALLKEKKRNLVIRNILASPLDQNINCNRISNQQFAVIKECLSTTVQRKEVQSRAKWIDLKDIGKEERRKLRMNEKTTSKLAGMLYGLNSVSRAVEKHAVQLVLLADDVNPQWLVRHVEGACVAHAIPSFRIPQLRVLMRDAFGFPAIAVAFQHFEHPIAQSIQNVLLRHFVMPAAVVSQPSPATSDVISPRKLPTLPTKSLCLYRANKKHRCFVPAPAQTLASKTAPTDFIAFEAPSSHSLYQPLQIKRIKGNVNRTK